MRMGLSERKNINVATAMQWAYAAGAYAAGQADLLRYVNSFERAEFGNTSDQWQVSITILPESEVVIPTNCLNSEVIENCSKIEGTYTALLDWQCSIALLFYKAGSTKRICFRGEEKVIITVKTFSIEVVDQYNRIYHRFLDSKQSPYFELELYFRDVCSGNNNSDVSISF